MQSLSLTARSASQRQGSTSCHIFGSQFQPGPQTVIAVATSAFVSRIFSRRQACANLNACAYSCKLQKPERQHFASFHKQKLLVACGHLVQAICKGHAYLVSRIIYCCSRLHANVVSTSVLHDSKVFMEKFCIKCSSDYAGKHPLQTMRELAASLKAAKDFKVASSK